MNLCYVSANEKQDEKIQPSSMGSEGNAPTDQLTYISQLM